MWWNARRNKKFKDFNILSKILVNLQNYVWDVEKLFEV